MFSVLDGARRGISNLSSALVLLAMSVLIFLVAADVVLRKFFNSPIHGGHDVSSILMITMVYGGFVVSWIEGRHIRLDLIDMLRPAVKRRLIQIGNAISFVVVALMASRLWGFTMEAREHGLKLGELLIPWWPFIMLIPVGLILMLLHVLANLGVKAAGRD